MHDRDFFDEDHWKPPRADERRIMEAGEPITDLLEHEVWNERREDLGERRPNSHGATVRVT